MDREEVSFNVTPQMSVATFIYTPELVMQRTVSSCPFFMIVHVLLLRTAADNGGSIRSLMIKPYNCLRASKDKITSIV